MSAEASDAMELKPLSDHPDAIPVIGQWYFDEWGHKINNNTYEKTCERLSGDLKQQQFPYCFVAVENETLIGAARLKLREMDIYPDYEHWLGSVFVPLAARGGGVAGRMAKK